MTEDSAQNREVTKEGERDVVIVGAGIGGLATAGRLAKEGFRVKVFEKNPIGSVGGRMNEKVLKGKYRFETGPSLMLLPDVYRETFEALGSQLDDFVKVVRVSPNYSVFFDDGTSIVLSDNPEEMEKQLEEIEEGAYQQYLKYLDVAQTNLDVGLPNFIREKFTLKGFDRFLANMFSAFPLENHYNQLCRFFESPKLRALMSFQDLYVGLSPYEAPAVFSLLQAIELNQGIYYPLGGFHQISKKLMSLCEDLNVEFNFEQQVSKVMVENDQAVGVELKTGEQVFADVVISNVDLPYTEKNLIPPAQSRSFEKAKYSSGVVAFYWALDKRYPQLSHHSIFLTEDYKESWEAIFTDNRMPSKGNFYVHAPARTDSSVCPEGHDAIMVLVPCPHLKASDDVISAQTTREMESLKKTAKSMVIKRFEQAGMANFESHIVSEFIYSPSEWRTRYNLDRGAVFGLAHGISQLSVFRPSPRHPEIRNLFFAGASTRPGNGVPLVLIGAEQVCQKIVSKS